MNYQRLRRREHAASMWNHHPWYKQSRHRAHREIVPLDKSSLPDGARDMRTA